MEAKEKVGKLIFKQTSWCKKCDYRICNKKCSSIVRFKQSLGKVICEIIEDEMEIRHCHKLLDRIQKVMGVV